MKEIAVHEAGHAVLLRHFGIALVRVKICGPHGNMPGGGNTDRGPDGHLSNEDQAVICVAGFAAECEYHHNAGNSPKNWNDFQNNDRYFFDRKYARNAITPCLPSDLPEDDNGEAEDEFIKRELARAKQLVAEPALWHAIKALAAKLYELGEIDGGDAMTIIDSHLKTWQA